MTRSLGARLFMAALLFLTLAILVVWLSLTRLFEDHVAREKERELQSIADTLTANLAVTKGELVLLKQPSDPRFDIPAGGRYWEVDGLQGGDARSRSLWDSDMGVPHGAYAGSNLSVLTGPAGNDLLVLTAIARFEDAGKELKAEIHTAADKSELDEALASFRFELLGMLGLTGALLAMASGLQILVGLKPLGELRHAVSSLRRGEINVINLAGPEEVKPLITEINTLMHDGRQAVERARARASDLAHGLKTPLTILGQIGETIAKEGRKAEAQQIADQVSTIRARVDRQLALARTGSLDQRAGLDVELALGRLVKVAGPLARSAEIALEVAIRGRHAVLADMTDFIEATGNIVDNAIRHASSQVVVTVTDLERSVRVDVSDDGPGIDEADRDRVMQRGIRLDEGGDGSGLGLAISADILRAYGGSISLAISDKGGLAVHMDWPAAADGDKKN